MTASPPIWHGSPPPPPRRTSWALLAALAVLLSGALGGGVWAALALGSRQSDVGDLAALAPIQAQLRPLDACEFHFNLTNRSSKRHVYLEPCGKGDSWSASVALPPSFSHGSVRVQGKRSSRSDRWEILVDRDSVAFPELQAALSEMSPIMARDYEAARRKADGEREAGKASEQEAEARRNRSKESYPSK